MINHFLGNSEINSIPEWRVFLLNKRKSLRLQQTARADIIHSNREFKEILTLKNSPCPLPQSIKVHRRALVLFAFLIPCHRCEKSARNLAALTMFDHATWQHTRENPWHVREAARIHDIRMVQFVLKIEKLSHIMGLHASQDLQSLSPIMAPVGIQKNTAVLNKHWNVVL